MANPKPATSRPQASFLPKKKAHARKPVTVPQAPEDVAHSDDVEKLRGELADAGITPRSCYPTKDRQGYVILSVEQVRSLLERRSAG